MAIELKFRKTDNTSWGFRLTGGADCDVPLTVIKVAEDSIAESVGLQVDDVIVRISDKATAGLTHGEVHNVLLEAGDDFTMAVRRGEMLNNWHDEDQSNAEICNIMESSIEEQHESKEEYVAALQVSEETRVSSKASTTDEKIAEAISGEAELLPEQNVLGVNFNKVDLSESTVLQALKDDTTDTTIDLQNKKWSTFLQKPKRSKVAPKKTEPEGPSAPPYRVIIKKQKKKNVLTTLGVTETQNQTPTEDVDGEVAEEDSQDSIDECIDENIEEDMNEVHSEQSDHGNAEEETLEREHEDEDEGHVDEESNSSPAEEAEEAETPAVPLPLEEQLAHVQQQLQALAQLPSTIQVTLDAVTKQLAKIVSATHLHTEEEITADQSVASEEEATELVTAETFEDTLETAEETLEGSDVEGAVKIETEMSDISTREPSEDDHENEEGEIDMRSTQANVADDITEEEQKAVQIEIEKAAHQERAEEFHQRRLEQRPTYPLTPLQRPIILPGGRRWSQPEDARPAPKKKSKMTDEKISETLDTFSEVIVGHTKGINFLKYQPPPANLEYLQHSEVFRLVHDMEPPSRGIAARPGKVASEQDYYGHEPFQTGQQAQLRM